jgi:hypothetical protein
MKIGRVKFTVYRSARAAAQAVVRTVFLACYPDIQDHDDYNPITLFPLARIPVH